ncbi:RNA polymerase sigma factor [Patulibacter defluvii]|uniref:RNA polymerase sigma factor n=1 Tax=Patulibacter defluvii TaxID=3095358 RepID=UPI002A74DF05|nr:sigma-70 family RNA polymerase sigma factor [Patulibacter sp. DM4]
MDDDDLQRPADRERFAALYAENAQALLGYALRRCPTPEDAADLVSDVFLVAWRRLDEVPAGADARPWLFGTARLTLANQRRGAARRTRLGQELRRHVGAAAGEDPAGALVRRERDGELERALAALSDLDRGLLTLIAWEGLTPAQAAVALGLRPAVVRVRLHRARQRLRRTLEEQEAAATAVVGPARPVAPAPAGERGPISDREERPA